MRLELQTHQRQQRLDIVARRSDGHGALVAHLRVRDHAVLQTLGDRSSLIARLVLVEGAVLGLCGGALGAVEPQAEPGEESADKNAQQRQRDNKIYFGQNLIHDGSGRLEVGMPVEVLA